MLATILLSKKKEEMPAAVAPRKGKERGALGNRLRRRVGECSVFTVAVELEPREVREERTSLAADVNEHDTLGKNSERETGE